MKLTTEEINTFKAPFLRRFIIRLNELVGDKWNIVFRIHNIQKGDKSDIKGINKQTALILWGDEYSRVFPTEYFDRAGVTIKCYCPDSWTKRGIIPMTDNAMIVGDDSLDPEPCSSRPYTIMYSANLNYRRTDLLRGLLNCSFGYPFRISSNYPITGSYPLWHKIEAVAMHKIITTRVKDLDFSHLYLNSYIRFHRGFMQGVLTPEEYLKRLWNSKISWCTAGFMTNETSRLIESACAGCAVMCGQLPDNPIYNGHPFIVVNDWRKVRQITDSLLNDPARMDELGSKSRDWYKSHFSPEKQAERVAAAIYS